MGGTDSLPGARTQYRRDQSRGRHREADRLDVGRQGVQSAHVTYSHGLRIRVRMEVLEVQGMVSCVMLVILSDSQHDTKMFFASTRFPGLRGELLCWVIGFLRSASSGHSRGCGSPEVSCSLVWPDGCGLDIKEPRPQHPSAGCEGHWPVSLLPFRPSEERTVVRGLHTLGHV